MDHMGFLQEEYGRNNIMEKKEWAQNHAGMREDGILEHKHSVVWQVFKVHKKELLEMRTERYQRY